MKNATTQVLGIAFSIACFSSAWALTPTGQLLTNPDFELSSPPLVSFGASGTGTWQQENAAFVSEPNDGVSACNGQRMLEIYRHLGSVSQVSQHVDVSAYTTDIQTGSVDAEGSLCVNSPLPGAVGVLAIRARTAANNLPSSLISSMSVPLSLDSDPTTWETINVSGFNLPTNTAFVTAEILYSNAGLSPLFAEGAFADGAFLQLVPEPSGGLLFGMGLLGFVRRKS